MILSKLRRLIKFPATALALSGPIEAVIEQDVIDPNIKTVRAKREVDTETGLDRIKRMFIVDDYDNVSPELHTIYNSGFMGFFVGIMYGGIMGSRKAHVDFLERNQASAFNSHFEAKKKLQESMVLAFGRTGWKFAWRMGVFCFMFMGTSTLISVYYNKYRVTDYVIGGVTTGAIYKWKMGPKGMASGAIVGGGLGLFAGLFTVGMLKLTGITMEEARYWQYKWKTERTNAYKEGFDKAMEETGYCHKNLIQDLHDERVGVTTQNLYALPDEPLKKESDQDIKKEDDKKPEEIVRKSEDATTKEVVKK